MRVKGSQGVVSETVQQIEGVTPLLCNIRIMRVGISLPNRDWGWLRQGFRHFVKTTKL